MNKKLLTIIEGAVAVTLGILIAVFGGIQTLGTYFGILFIISGALALVLAFVALFKTQVLGFGGLFIGGAFVALGTALLIHPELFGFIVYIVALLVIAAGAALAVYGVFTIVKHSLFYGIGQIVVGLLAITVAVLFLKVPEFNVAFWIIVGVLVAVYGVFLIVSAFVGDKEDKVIEQKAK